MLNELKHILGEEVGKDKEKYENLSQKQFLGSSPTKYGFCISETNYDRRTGPGPQLIVSVRRLRQQNPQTRKSVLAFEFQ
jgi:hypothetical protein